MRAAAFVVALVLALVQAGAAFAHATLVRAEPADGTLVAQPPAALRLTFNEPVSPLVIRLIAPDGTVTMPKAVAENATVTVIPPPLAQGTHVLSWRVISADGHPVGGALVFSVGVATERPSPGALTAGDPMIRAALWGTKLVIYAAIFIGIGGAFFRAWLDTLSTQSDRVVVTAPSLRLRGEGMKSGSTIPGWVRGAIRRLRASGCSPSPVFLRGTTAQPSPRKRGEGAAMSAHGWLDRLLMGLVAVGLGAVPLSVGLQGLDALDTPLSGLAQGTVWAAGLGTSYGFTAIALAFALFAALFSFAAPRPAARVLTLAGMTLVGLALALSGHASNAMPQALTRPSVFVHVVCVAFWIGALLPLVASLRDGDGRALTRFTRLIPYPLAALLLSGAILTVVQLDRIDALWTTRYGAVLSCKLAAVAALLALAVANRYRLASRYQAQGGAAAARPLARSIAAEVGIAVAIFALVAGWRFTPPPRALAAAAPIAVHLHGPRAMVELTLTPERARPPRVALQVFDATFNQLAVKEVTLTLANPSAGIEPLRRMAAGSGSRWRVADLRVPFAGLWTIRVDLLIDDFENVVLEEQVELPRLP